jgi:hypothetical protein
VAREKSGQFNRLARDATGIRREAAPGRRAMTGQSGVRGSYNAAFIPFSPDKWSSISN